MFSRIRKFARSKSTKYDFHACHVSSVRITIIHGGYFIFIYFIFPSIYLFKVTELMFVFVFGN